MKLLLALSVVAATPALGADRLPNILLILADDLGYGDVKAYNPKSKVETPNIDQLAREGSRFTDAHAATWCVPSRYELLTGRHLFRNHRDYGKQALIERDRSTIASLLKQAGYATAMIGKWHLSFEGGTAFNYNQPLRGGPIDHGFDRFFGIHGPLNVAPFFFIENDRVVEVPTLNIEEHHTPGMRSIQGELWNGGVIAPGFRHEEVLPRLADRAVQYLENRARTEQPFFLYFAMTAPHVPWLPAEQFRGKSGAGMYGDFVMQVDEVVGRVVAALEKAGKADDTLLIFTSDNGPQWFEEEARRYGHHAAGEFRGMKNDAWEGGHRVPFIVRWPGKIASNSSSTQLVSLADLFATFAHLTGQRPKHVFGEDSIDALPSLLGQRPSAAREVIVHEAVGADGKVVLAIRQGNWKLIPSPGEVSYFEGAGFDASGKHTITPPRSEKDVVVGEPPGKLYNLAADPGERRNEYFEHPETVRRLTQLLERYRHNGLRSK